MQLKTHDHDSGIIIDLPEQGYQQRIEPTQTDRRWLSLLFSALLVCYVTAVCVQLLSFIPLTLPAMAQLPKVAGVVIISVGVWLAWLRRRGGGIYLPVLTLSFAIGLLVGL